MVTSIEADRYTGAWFFLDANRINARQGDTAMNQLEEWCKHGVIYLEIPEPAATEASCPPSSKRAVKVVHFAQPLMLNSTTPEQAIRSSIAHALFGNARSRPNDEVDVDILFVAWKYGRPLITEDGDSKRQPRGILGARRELKELGITVLKTSEAVHFVRRRIAARDKRARTYAEETGKPLPTWVDVD